MALLYEIKHAMALLYVTKHAMALLYVTKHAMAIALSNQAYALRIGMRVKVCRRGRGYAVLGLV